MPLWRLLSPFRAFFSSLGIWTLSGPFFCLVGCFKAFCFARARLFARAYVLNCVVSLL